MEKKRRGYFTVLEGAQLCTARCKEKDILVLKLLNSRLTEKFPIDAQKVVVVESEQ